MSGVELQVGRRYRLDVWTAAWIEPTYLGTDCGVAVDDRGIEVPIRVHDNWVEVLPPIEVLEGSFVEVNAAGGGKFGVEDMNAFPPGRWQALYVPADRADEAVKRIKGES